MSETRKFPTEVVASLSTGVMLCDFDAMHEFAEFIMGHPIWTHQFADKELCAAMQREVLAQYPSMPTMMEGVTPDNYFARKARLIAELGATQMIRKGNGSTALSRTDGIPDHIKKFAVIKV